MNETSIQSDFENLRLTIERRFNATVDRVWQAYTDPELLDQWWAPKPWKTETITMDFREGGYWFYSMNGPEGEKHHCQMHYHEIVPRDHYAAHDVFTDAAGEAIAGMPKQTFVTTFEDEGDTTQVEVVLTYESAEDLQAILDMGMAEGVTMAQNQLEDLLANQQ